MHEQNFQNFFRISLEQNSYPTGGPLAAASKMVPVPESLMSPDCCPQILPHKVASMPPAVIQQPKVLKTKPENRIISSPKIRSPQMKRVERSPIASPKKLGNSNLKSCMATTDLGSRKKPVSTVNSVHISPPYGSGTISSDEDSDNFSVDKVRAIRNQVKLRFVFAFVFFGSRSDVILQISKTKGNCRSFGKQKHRSFSCRHSEDLEGLSDKEGFAGHGRKNFEEEDAGVY